MVDPHLPDILEGVVSRVDAAFSARLTDPFHVFFEKGMYNQVWREIKENDPAYENTFPLIWLVMPYEMKRNNFRIWGLGNVSLRIIARSSSKYTQQQREDLVFKPRILPIYKQLMKEIGREKWFSFPGPNQIKHRPIMRPFWTMGNPAGTDSKNLFDAEVDEMYILNLELPIKLQNCSVASFPGTT